KPGPTSADRLVVDAAKPDVNAVLTHGVRLSGRITDASDPTRPLPGASVSAYRSPGFEWVAGVAADADGNYSLFVPPGDYFLYFSPPYPSDYLAEYWNDKVDQAAADVVHVTGAISDLNAGLARGLRISGRVIDESGRPIPGIFVPV